jgi:pimeloyl-ACP methyl ester carboxylesterase
VTARSRVVVDGAALDARFTPAAAWASPAAAPLVFLHEGLGSVDLWRDFPDAVRARAGGPAMLVYSRRGYGRSDPAELPRPVTYMHHEAAVVLPAVLARFGLDRPVLVGHSDGASIALLYAGAGHPVRALVLIAPHVLVEDVTVAAIAEARDAYAATDLRARMAHHHDDVDATFRGWNDIWLDPAFRSWNIEASLPGVTCPVLLVQSSADPFGTAAQLDTIETGVTGPVRRLRTPTPGHAPHLDDREPTLDAVAAFLAESAGA